LEGSFLGAGIDVVDGGTGGFHLLALLQDYPRVVMIDAAADGKPPGTVSVLKPRFANDFPKSLSAHDIGLKDLVEAAALLGGLPEIDLITVSVEGVQPMSLDLSPAVAAAMPEIERRVKEMTDCGERDSSARTE
jgi:hydrogenase maturation protease